jgi:hypothetical protein
MNQEIKGNLAKLLATENLLVQHKAVKTASFDVHSRMLTLPIWKGLSSRVYDLLVGHEVGHALFTPDRDMTDCGAPKDYVNVTEDARVEKLMKRKYLGLRKDFFEGYRQLQAMDFFGIDNEDVNAMSLADRVNLHFKIGHFIDIKFSVEEQHIVSLVDQAETFDEAVEAARLMAALHSNDEQSVEIPLNGTQEGSNSGSSSPIEQQADKGDTDDSGDDGEDVNEESDSSVGGSGWHDSVTTAEHFSDALENRASTNHYDENTVIEIPGMKVEDLVVSNSDFLKVCEEYYSHTDTSIADSEFAMYRKFAAREVNYLVKEFECKKSAAAYARTTVSKTGVLDTAKLHTYKYNDDIFRKINVIPDGKNHGLIALIDWSGSIADVSFNMIKQLANIAWFCKKVQIPFNAYLFTTEWPREHTNFRATPNTYCFNSNFSLINVITTDVSAREFENQLKYLFRLSAFFSSYGNVPVFYAANALGYPIGCQLGGTPLSDAINSLHTVMPYFRKKYKVEKLNVIVLSDGEAGAGGFTGDIQSYDDPESYLVRQVEGRAQLRNRNCGVIHPVFDQGHLGNMKIYIDNVKISFPESNIVCFRMIDNRDVGSWVRTASWMLGIEDTDKFRSRLRKERTMVVGKGLGYDAFYLITTKSLSLDTDFEVDNNASKAQIKSAFKKSLGNKSVNKKILSSFAAMVS